MCIRQAAGVACLLVLVVSCTTTADQYISRGKSHFDAGRYSDASLNFRKAVQKDGTSAEAQLQLGLTEVQLGNFRDAYTALVRASELAPDREDITVHLGDLALRTFQNEPSRPRVLYETVQQQADKLLRKNTASYHGLRFRAHIAAIDRKVDEAVALFQKAQALKPLEPDTALPLAGGLIAAGKTEEAERLASQVIAKHPKAADVYDFLYFRYRDTGREQQAEQLLRSKVHNNPGNAGYVLQLAAHYARAGKQQEADQELKRLLADRKSYPNADLEVAEFYAGTGRSNDALTVLREGIKDTPDSRKPEFRRQIAFLLAHQGKRDESLQIANELKKTGSATNDVLRLRATLLMASGGESDVRTAIEDLQALREALPGDMSVRMQLAQAWTVVNDLRKAQAELSSIVKARKELIEPRLALGEVNRRLAGC